MWSRILSGVLVAPFALMAVACSATRSSEDDPRFVGCLGSEGQEMARRTSTGEPTRGSAVRAGPGVVELAVEA